MAKLSFFVLVSLAIQALGKPFDKFDPASYSPDNVIDRDIAIIGGGSSGTFAAITLRKAGRSLVVVEKQDRLGGHVQTYVDPASKVAVNYGVRLFSNTSITDQFFKDVNATMGPFQIPPQPTFANFRTGEVVTDFVPYNNFTGYEEQFARYPYLEAGNGYDLPTPVPADLSLGFGDFLKKHNISNIAYSAWVDPSMGDIGRILTTPVLYVFKALTTLILTQEGESGTTLVSTTGDNHVPFANALEILGSDVLLSSVTVDSKRSTNGTTLLVVQTPSGNKLLRVGKVLFTAAQTLQNLKPLNLDRKELSVFKQLKHTGFYSGAVSGKGIPTTFNFQNVALETKTDIPRVPDPMHFYQSEVPGVYSWWYQSNRPINNDTIVRNAVANSIYKLTNGSATDVEFLAYADNSPGILYATPEGIQNGFWDQLANLQGYRSVYWGGLLNEPSSAGLWQFTLGLLKKADLL